jgi:beta-N-acetylhexosaminidase
MTSTAVYPALGSTRPAALSPNVVGDLRALGFDGVIVTDALQTPAVDAFMSTSRAAVEAVRAGDDLLLAAGPTNALADTDGASSAAYSAVLAAARGSRVVSASVRRAYERVLRLKHRLPTS